MFERKYTWFVKPLDSHTNRIIAQEIPEENFSYDLLCENNTFQNLWQCPNWLVRYLWDSREDLDLKFKIFNREGNGKIRECTFLFENKKTGKSVVKK